MKDEAIELHSKGLSNRQIAKKLHTHHSAINKLFKELNIESNWNKRQHLDLIDEYSARCSECNEIKPRTEFQHGRKGQQYEYQYSYCNTCRRNRYNKRIINNLESYMNERVGALRRRCRDTKIPFDLTTEFMINLYRKQNGKCFYTDQEMVWGSGVGLQWNSLSFDRIIPTNGYIQTNTILCTRRINAIKFNMTLSEMKKWTPEWYQRIINYLNECGRNLD